MNNTPHKISEYKGQRFGRLEARADDPNNSKVGTHWWFLCDCGNYVSRRATSVLKGRTQSCGCKRGDWLKAMRKDMREVSKLRAEIESLHQDVYDLKWCCDDIERRQGKDA